MNKEYWVYRHSNNHAFGWLKEMEVFFEYGKALQFITSMAKSTSWKVWKIEEVYRSEK